MQLDKSVMKRVESNGMIVALSAVYDLDNDTSRYEVTKTLTGEVLSKFSTEVLERAMPVFRDYAMEIGAYDQLDGEEFNRNADKDSKKFNKIE